VFGVYSSLIREWMELEEQSSVQFLSNIPGLFLD
jgi:hypothetical protein